MSFPYNPDPGRDGREAARRASDQARWANQAAGQARRASRRGGGPSGCGCLGLMAFLAAVAAAAVLIAHDPQLVHAIWHHLSSPGTP